MPIGSKHTRGGDEYLFIDGKALRADEAVRLELSAADTAPVPGQTEAPYVPGAAGAQADSGSSRRRRWSASRALDELESSPAFELIDDFQISLRQALDLRESDRRSTRRMALVMGVALLVVAAFSLCVSVNTTGLLYSPVTVAQALAERLRLFVGQVLGLSYYDVLSAVRANEAIPGYADIAARFDITMVTLVCGGLLSLSGMMYQNVFRNPIAAPSMLGVSAGVRLGTIVLCIVYGVNAAYMEGMRYVFCYIGGIVIILMVIGFSKLLAGRGRSINVVDMLIVGSVLSQLLATVSTFFLTYIMDDDLWEVFYTLTSGMRTTVEWYAFVFLAIVIVVSVVPVVLMRFRLNVVAFDDSDARVLGVNPERMRVFVLVLGTVMILAAQIHVGVISMVALVVPFLVRYIVGSEFGKQLLGNMLIGPLLLLVCRDICSLIPFVGAGLSLEMVVGFVALPVYIWMMALGKRGWE